MLLMIELQMTGLEGRRKATGLRNWRESGEFIVGGMGIVGVVGG